MSKLIRLCLLLATGLSAGISQANYALSFQANQEQLWQAQREHYNDTLKLLTKGQRERFREQAETLRDYPLYPYLKYREYSRYISSVSKEELDEFMDEFSDSPLSGWLRRRWINNLASQKDWDTYLQEYRLGQYDNKYDCYYYWAHYKVGDRETAFAGARQLWLVGASQDNACDPLFEVWKTTGEMYGDLAWERTALAMANSKIQLARYLENHLPKQLQPLSREWRDLYRDPRRLKYMKRYTKWGDSARPLLITAFSRLIRKDEKLAQELWPQYVAAFNFSAAERAKIANEFAFVLAVRKQDNADFWLSQAAQYGYDDELIPIGIRHALYEQDWPRLRIWLTLLNEEQWQDETWQYWQARAEQKLGEVDITQLPQIRIDPYHVDVLTFQQRFSQALYDERQFMDLLPESVVKTKFTQYDPQARLEQLSEQRNFYGFLASERLKKPLNLNIEPTQVREEDLNAMIALPAVQRTRELYAMDDLPLARSEWEYLIRRSNEQERSVLAHLAYIWGWHHPAIRAAYQSDAYNNLEIRFPTAFETVVNKYASSSGLDKDWVYSLIRQESAFMPQARSSVGAMGMMQIMPRTAKQLSQSIGIPTPSTRDMLTPETNIKLGTHYMSQLQQQFKGNIILATAAYNAGPHRANAWQPTYLPVSGDIWVETIPFKETRNYVKNILTYQAIYRHHLGQEVKLSDALKLIPAKKMQATVMR
ncbi:MAG: transglycosylase SLT domain-containing protein [Pseudomonadota bacterium]|nr:transglycosylase SLT domain-containing protein [Pseudomonadota bacterium]